MEAFRFIVRWFVISFKCNKSWLNVLKVFFMKVGCGVSLACLCPKVSYASKFKQ